MVGLGKQLNGEVVDDEYLTHKPCEVSAIEAAKSLKGKKHIMLLTGAGLSAASGIPTFRGANGFWTKKNPKYSDPMEILTNETFCTDPEVVWEWHFEFLELMSKCKVNEGHKAILEF